MMNININNVEVGDKNRSFIIAELSANHNGSLEVAYDTIKAAKRAGADAIKFQTYTADTITLDVKSEEFKINHGTAWDGKYLWTRQRTNEMWDDDKIYQIEVLTLTSSMSSAMKKLMTSSSSNK